MQSEIRNPKSAILLALCALLALCPGCQTFTPHEPDDWEPISEKEAAENLQWFRTRYYDADLTNFLNGTSK
jgi:hypothetical protein